MKHILFGCCCLWCIAAQAQDCHLALHGRITDGETNEPLPYASIFVKEAEKGAYSDEDGNYLIDNLCEKTSYTITVSHIECEHISRNLELMENSTVDFVLPSHKHDALGEVIISAQAVELQKIQAVQSIEGLELGNIQAQGLGATVRDLPGLSLLQTGATIAKPVIQGLSGNRIAILTNGVVLEGQQWGTEHAPEVDPFSAGKITVVKGADGVRYGTSAMGGAILIEPADLREVDGFGGWAALSGSSNGRGGTAAAALDWKPQNGTSAFRLQGSLKRLGNLATPGYFLENTGQQEANFSIQSRFSSKKWQFEGFFSQFNQKIGLLRASHTGNLQDLQNAIAAERPLNNADEFAYTIGRPRQEIRHDLLKIKAERPLAELWKLRLQYAFQYNQRSEFDAHKGFGGSPTKDEAQIQFFNATNTLETAFEHRAVRHWSGEIGAQGLWQYNQTGTGGYVPDHLNLGASVWAVERWRRFPHPLEYEAGLRCDFRHIHITDSVGRSPALDTTLIFANISATGGILWRFAEGFSLNAHSALAWRPPYPTELFARGVHHGAAIFERGNAGMVSEKAWNNSLTLEKTGKGWQGSLSVYANWIRDFIYLQPEADFAVTVRGVFPIYSYQQADAFFTGLDAQFLSPSLRGFAAEGKIALLAAKRKIAIPKPPEGNTDFLPLMPSNRIWYALIWEKSSVWRAKLGANTIFQQKNIPAIGLLKDAPKTYTLLTAELNWSGTIGRKKTEIGLRANNLGNAKYRDYMDFFRFFADAPGVDVGLRLRIFF